MQGKIPKRKQCPFLLKINRKGCLGNFGEENTRCKIL
jgi:hypothetical protein